MKLKENDNIPNSEFFIMEDGNPTKKNTHEFYKDKIGFYGFFEAIEDQEVANVLFDTAANWLRERGLTAMQGPMNPSTNHECGLLVRGQSQHPTMMTTWNPKYYEDLHDQAGFKGVQDLVAYIIMTPDSGKLPPKLHAYVEKIKSENLSSMC